MNPSRKKRLAYFLVSVVVVLLLVKFIFNSLQKNTIYFFSPTDLSLSGENPKGLIRVGGLVKKGSVQEKKNEAIYAFVVTDLKNDIYVEYKGILPNLFQEEKQYQKALYYIRKALHIDDSNPMYWRKYAEINLKLNFYVFYY